MNHRRLSLVIALGIGCAAEPAPEPEDTIEQGVHIDVEIEAGLEPCGDLVGHMDRFIELLADAWGVDLAGRHYNYRWLTPETYLRESGCPEGSLGCARGDTALSQASPTDHELVHLVSFAIGRPPSFLIEGAAVAFGLPDSDDRGGPPVSDSITSLLTGGQTPYPAYDLAGAYTSHLIDRFGLPAYLEFYGSLRYDAELEVIAAAHEVAFAEPLDATIAAFDDERGDCDYERYRIKLFECAAPRIAWQGELLTLRRSISCADDDVVGPFYGTARASTYLSFEVTSAGLHELSTLSDASVSITLGSCGGCESRAPITLSAGAGPRRIELDAGLHYLRLDARATDESTVSLRLRRVLD